MRFVLAILVLLGSALGSYASIRGVEILSGNDQAQSGVVGILLADRSAPDTFAGLVTALERYTDQDYGFQMAVPSGWSRIGINHAEAAIDTLDLGYAVGFEAPRQSMTDEFADYILIEVLPGTDSGLFEADGDNRYSLRIGGESIEYDRLYIDSKSDNTAAVDLVIFQREIQALGYTVDFYAIGEPANEQALFDAFQVMLRTFEMNAAPFKVS